MGSSRTADLVVEQRILGRLASYPSRKERKPLRPIAAHFEEVIEVNESAGLEVFDQSRQGVLRWQRPQCDQSFNDTEFLIGKVVTRVDGTPHQPDPFKRTLSYQNNGTIMTKLQCHELGSIGD